MNIVIASITYFVLMFTTVFSWFVLGQYVVNIIVAIVAATSSIDSRIAAVGQNVVAGTNFMFIAFLIVWTIWYVYVAHHKETEQSYQVRRY